MSKVKTVDQVDAEIMGLLQGKGVGESVARTVTNTLVYADARGTKSHGVNMLAAYLDRIDNGGIDVDAHTKVIREDEVSVALDGCNGFGQLSVYELLTALLEKAEKSAVVCGTVKNINHCGALAYYTEAAAQSGYLAFLFVNANPTVAPFGGMEAVLGTNPMSIAIPYGDKPIVLDMASSRVAKAKIYHAAEKHERIDPSWALDSDGNPTDDPQKAIHGVLTAMAGPKGYGIAVAVEVLAGVLSGGGVTGEVSSVHKKTDKGMNAGACMILIDPKAFLDEATYNRRMSSLVAEIKGAKPQPGKHIFLPGEIEQGLREQSYAQGITYGGPQ